MRMLHEYLKARGRAKRRTRGEGRRSFRAVLDSLEGRIAPAGNLVVTNDYLVNSSNAPLSSVSAGDRVYVHVDYTTQGLPSGASYRLGITVNGMTRYTSYTTAGAGASGTGSYYYYWGTYVATPGANQVTAVVDPDQSVPESSYADNTRSFSFNATLPTSGTLTYSVEQIRAAYGVDSIPNFGTATPDGTGQTIAIIDAYNDPNILTDLDGFDRLMHLSSNTSPTLYQQYGSAASTLSVYNQAGVDITSQIANSGVGAVPPVDPTGGWEGEETLDVEWAHAIAPGAHIDLIETNGATGYVGLLAGAGAAARLPGVSVISMSWIYGEGNWSGSNGAGELAYDSSTFQTPAGHTGITFLASSGDGGHPGGYPAFSPNVVAVGGTQLTTNNNAYGSETAWSFPTPRTLNYGSSSYSQSGSWALKGGGFSGTYGTAARGANTATWTTPIASADQGWVGGTEVSATWVPAAGNATNATYRIYDGTSTSGTLLGTVAVNQTVAPLGTADGNAQFQELGDYYPTSGSLTVTLSASNANGTVAADAIGIAPAWATGGDRSRYEAEPSYQLPYQSTGSRTTPDVAFDGSDFSGVTCYQNGSLGFDYFGTSLSSPCWAGLFAIIDQGRAANGQPTLDGPSNPTQALQGLYSLPAADFHDVTTGYNGYFAGPGYDELTGRGTPVANLLVPDMVAYGVPTVATPASASPNPVTGTTTALHVLGADVLGSSSLKYTWATTVLPVGASTPTFSANGTNDATDTIATFYQAGTYTFTVTIADPTGASTTSAVTVTVLQTASSIVVTPASATVPQGSTAQFSASVLDQFGVALASQPAVTWSVDAPGAGGTVDATGLYAAPPVGAGSGLDVVRATLGAVSGAATVNVAVTPTTVVAASVGWGAAGSAPVFTDKDGLRLLPAGRTTDLPWLGIRQITLTLAASATLAPGDVTVTSATGTDYGPVTVSGSGTTYVITLATPIAGADRVTIAIGNATIAPYIRRLDVLPGDVTDDGVVNASDMVMANLTILESGSGTGGGTTAPVLPLFIVDVDGSGTADATDVQLIRRRIGNRLP